MYGTLCAALFRVIWMRPAQNPCGPACCDNNSRVCGELLPPFMIETIMIAISFGPFHPFNHERTTGKHVIVRFLFRPLFASTVDTITHLLFVAYQQTHMNETVNEREKTAQHNHWPAAIFCRRLICFTMLAADPVHFDCCVSSHARIAPDRTAMCQ